MTRRYDKYSVSVPGNRAVSRMTIEFATPLNGNGRMSRGREHPDSDSDTQNVSTAPRATPTHIDATPVMIEHSHLPSRLRALRNYLVHRLARDSSRHVNAETYAATNEHATSEPNSPETTPKVRSNNESTSTSDSSSAFATELIVEASDVGRHTAPERALRQMQEHLSARLDGVERGPPYTSPLSSFTNPSSSQSPKYDGNLPETKAADGHNGIFSAPRAGHASPARALPGLPSVRDAASRTLASNARHVPLVSPRPACAPPPHSPPGLQSYRRQSRTGANNGRNGPPVTPTSLNFSGQSIANSPPFMLETRDGTLPEGVSNGVPTSSLQASGGATPTALGPYPSQPLGGVQDGANATSSQPHDDLDDSMPPAPSQLPIPLPDVEEHDDDAAPPPLLRVPVPLPDIGEPEIKLSPPRVPDPVLESHDFGCDDSNALDLHLTHSEPPNLLPRLENHHRIPNPVMVYDDSETDLARERARARLLRLLYESNRSSSPFKYDLQRKPASPIPAGLSGFDLLDHGPFSPVISPCLPPRTPNIRSPAPTALAPEGCDGTQAAPPSTSAPLSRSPPGLPSRRRRTRKTSIAPVTPISVNFSGLSIATSSQDTFEAWNSTPPETYHSVHSAMPLPTIPPLSQAHSCPLTDVPYPSLPPDGVWDDANTSLPQSYEKSDWAMPPPPLQLPIPLPDVDDPVIELTPKRLTVYPPTVHGNPSSLGLDVPLRLPSPIQPHPQYEKHYRYHQFWEEWDLATFLNTERTQIQRTQVQHTQVLPPMRLSRRPDPQMIEYHHAVSALLARKRADARLRRILFGAKSLWPSIHPAGGLGDPGLPAEAPRQRTAKAPPKLAHAQMNAQSVGLGLASTVEDNNPLANPTKALNSSTERPTVAADVDRPPVPTSVPTAVMLSIRTFDPATMPATRGSTTSDKEKHDIPTYIGGLKVSRTCAGLRLVIDVDTPDRSKPSCSTYFYGGFELAMESLRGVLEVDGRPHNLTELSLRINRLRDRKDHDIMMTVVSQLGDFLRYFHLVDIHMQCADKIDWTVDLCAVRHKFGQLRHLRISGAAWSQRFECFPLDRIAQLDVMVPITVPDILELLRRTEKLNFLVLHFVQGREDLLKQHTKGKEPKHQNLPRALHVKCQGNISAELLGVLGRAHAGPTADVRLFVDQPVPMEVVSLFAERHWSLAITK